LNALSFARELQPHQFRNVVHQTLHIMQTRDISTKFWSKLGISERSTGLLPDFSIALNIDKNFLFLCNTTLAEHNAKTFLNWNNGKSLFHCSKCTVEGIVITMQDVTSEICTKHSNKEPPILRSDKHCMYM